MNLIRQGFLLLNDNHFIIPKSFENKECEYLCTKLKGNVIVIPPLTYLLSTEDEDRGIITIIFFCLLLKFRQIKKLRIEINNFPHSRTI
jgi:hypothetical protein